MGTNGWNLEHRGFRSGFLSALATSRVVNLLGTRIHCSLLFYFQPLLRSVITLQWKERSSKYQRFCSCSLCTTHSFSPASAPWTTSSHLLWWEWIWKVQVKEKNSQVMLCFLGIYLVCGPQSWRLQVFRVVPPYFPLLAPFESQRVNCFLVSVLQPLLLAIDKNCNEFGLSFLLLSQQEFYFQSKLSIIFKNLLFIYSSYLFISHLVAQNLR